MKDPTPLLRFSYWFGAILDGVMVIPLLWPRLLGTMQGWDDFSPSGRDRYVVSIGAALMAGWTALLIWADRRPLERKGVLMLTAVPVLVSMMASRVVAIASGVMQPQDTVNLVPSGCLVALFVVAYRRAVSFERTR